MDEHNTRPYEQRFASPSSRRRFELLQAHLRTLTEAFNHAQQAERDEPDSRVTPSLVTRYDQIVDVLAAAIQLLEGGVCFSDQIDTDYYIPHKLNRALRSYGLAVRKQRVKPQAA